MFEKVRGDVGRIDGAARGDFRGEQPREQPGAGPTSATVMPGLRWQAATICLRRLNASRPSTSKLAMNFFGSGSFSYGALMPGLTLFSWARSGHCVRRPKVRQTDNLPVFVKSRFA